MILPYLTQIPLSQVSSFLKKSEHSLFVSQSAFPCRKSNVFLNYKKDNSHCYKNKKNKNRFIICIAYMYHQKTEK